MHRDSYVERNIAVATLSDWCIAPHPNPTRMRSVTGPPGCGKTTLLHKTGEELDARDVPMVWLTLADGRPDDFAGQWHWAGNQGVWMPLLAAGDVERAAAGVEEFIAIAASASSQGMAPVLLADGYDELEPAERQWVEQHILIPFLFPNEVANPQSRIVLARRDKYALSAARLRWEDVTFPLEGLTDPAAQLWALLRADPAAIGATMVAPAAVIAAIAALDDDARAALVAALQAMLTPNPFVNLHLLERHFQHPAISLGPDDCQHCLAMYVERAGLSRDYVEVLVRRAQQYRAGQFDISQYDDKKELGVLVGAGVISHVPDSPRFQLEAAVVHLVAHMPAPAQPQGN